MLYTSRDLVPSDDLVTDKVSPVFPQRSIKNSCDGFSYWLYWVFLLHTPNRAGHPKSVESTPQSFQTSA